MTQAQAEILLAAHRFARSEKMSDAEYQATLDRVEREMARVGDHTPEPKQRNR